MFLEVLYAEVLIVRRRRFSGGDCWVRLGISAFCEFLFILFGLVFLIFFVYKYYGSFFFLNKKFMFRSQYKLNDLEFSGVGFSFGILLKFFKRFLREIRVECLFFKYSVSCVNGNTFFRFWFLYILLRLERDDECVYLEEERGLRIMDLILIIMFFWVRINFFGVWFFYLVKRD